MPSDVESFSYFSQEKEKKRGLQDSTPIPPCSPLPQRHLCTQELGGLKSFEPSCQETGEEQELPASAPRDL